MNLQAFLLTVAAADVPSSNVFHLNLQTLVQIGINLLNVAILAFILAKLLYKPVCGLLAARENRIKSQLETARDSMEKADEQKLQYEEKLGNIDLERKQILDGARELASQEGHAIVEDAKREAATLKARAAEEIEMERLRLVDEVKEAIIDVSSAMTAKFVTISIDKETHDRLFAETVAEMEEMPWRS